MSLPTHLMLLLTFFMSNVLAYAIEKLEIDIEASGIWVTSFQASKIYGSLLAAGLLTFDLLLILFGALVLRRITQRHGMNKSCTFYDIDSSDSSDSNDSTDSVKINPSLDNYNDQGRETFEEYFDEFDSDVEVDKTENFIDEYHEYHEEYIPQDNSIRTIQLPISHINSRSKGSLVSRNGSSSPSFSYSSTQVSIPRTMTQRSSLHSNSTSPRISSIRSIPISSSISHTNSTIPRMPRMAAQIPSLHSNFTVPRVNSIRKMPISSTNSTNNSTIPRIGTARTGSISSSNSYGSTQVSMPRTIVQRSPLHSNSTIPRVNSIRTIPNSPINSAMPRNETIRRTRSVQLPAPVARIERGTEKRKFYYSYI